MGEPSSVRPTVVNITFPQNMTEAWNMAVRGVTIGSFMARTWVIKQRDSVNKGGSQSSDQIIAELAPKLLFALQVVIAYKCLLSFSVGLGMAIYQSTRPGHLEEQLDRFTNTYIPLSGKKYGWISVITENKENAAALAAILCIYSSTIPFVSGGMYCGYSVGKAIFNKPIVATATPTALL